MGVLKGYLEGLQSRHEERRARAVEKILAPHKTTNNREKRAKRHQAEKARRRNRRG